MPDVRHTQFRRAIECEIAAVRTNAILWEDVPMCGTIMDRIDAMKVFSGRTTARARQSFLVGLPRGEHKVRTDAVEPEAVPSSREP
jgi:hypothetical protein